MISTAEIDECSRAAPDCGACEAARYVYTKLYEETPDRRGVPRSTISSKLRSFDHSPLVAISTVLHSSITGRKDIIYGEIGLNYVFTC